MELNTTLLRERFVITEVETPDEPALIALSNRIALTMKSATGNITETLIIRAQNMHSCIRMASQLLHAFLRTGPIAARSAQFDFAEVWDRIVPDHDVKYNPQRWVAVYAKGKPLFTKGDYHAFLDVVEKCDAINPGNYDRAVQIAEDTFRKMGRELHIKHESNIGMVIHVKADTGRCGLILRNPHKTTTFNFIAEGRATTDVLATLCLNACAAFLEGIQLAVRVGMVNEKIRCGLLDSVAFESSEALSGEERLMELSATLEEFEANMDVRYRPDRPDFVKMTREAANFQRGLLV